MHRESQQWTRVLAADELEVGRPRTLKLSDRATGARTETAGASPAPASEDGAQRKQIVLFRLGSGEIHAIDNRCPHEGYPLSTGALKDGILTCEWHNWKFRLCDGVCVLGGENVRHYPVRVQDGAIWLDTADPPLEDAQPRLFESLGKAFEENDWGQAGRTVERLLAAGATPATIVGHGCDWAAEHAPYGFDHGLATAADLIAILDHDDFAESPGVPILEALSLLGEPNLRRPGRDMGAPVPVPGDGSAVEQALRQRIEDEDVAGAEGLLRGALADGAGPDDVFRWLTHAATDHFWDYGHGHIFTVKAEELLGRIGWQHAHPVLTSLVTSLAYGTREDRLPYMRSYVDKMAAHQPSLPRWSAQAGPDRGARPDPDRVLAAVVDGNLSAALDAVAAELDRGVAPDRIALVLALGAAQRLLRFDHRLEHRDDVSEGWLSITHALTHADAVRESLVRRPSAEALRGLFLSARFVQHLAACDLPATERTAEHTGERTAEQLDPAALDPDATEQRLIEALLGHDAAGAMAAVRHGLATGAPVGRAMRRFAVADGASLPIFVSHHIKATLAALRLTDALAADPDLAGRPDRDLPALAAARFLAHPLRERRVARRALVAQDFVQAGRSPIRLLGY